MFSLKSSLLIVGIVALFAEAAFSLSLEHAQVTKTITIFSLLLLLLLLL